MKLAVVQSSVKPTILENLHHVDNIMALLPNDIDMIVLPEMFVTPYENRYFNQNSIQKNDENYQFISQLAKKYNVFLVAGSVPEKHHEKLYNTSFVFNPKGEEIAKYRKIHLFQVEYPDGTTYSEGDVLSAGEKITTFDTPFGKIGVIICFDARFPKLARKLRKKGVKMIVAPAAFNDFTGPLHFDLTFRARAMDNQLFMVAASPSSNSFGEYNVYGHSLVVDPYGKIIEQLDKAEDVIITTVDFNLIDEVRKAIPIVKNEKKLN